MEQRRSGRQKCSKGGEKLIRISQLKLPITHTKAQLEKKIAKTLKNPGNSFTYEIRKQSLDCRHKNDKIFVYTVDVTIRDEQKLAKKVNNNNIMLIKEKPYEFPSPGETPLLHSPVIVGSGPAGLFCGWYLAKAGYCPIILERGEEAEKRQKTVENFWKNGVLDPESNVQFGEGGAGTFSDGKLNTLVKDPYGRNHEVLKRFVAAGAPEEIIYQQKPHLGTDVLVGIVEKMRHEIEEKLGIKAYDIYGLSEIAGPGVGYECECQHGTHLNEDHYFPEIIDPNTLQPVEPGQTGELVFTHLTKEGMPLLRYRTRDLTALHYDKCSCGRTLVRMDRILGRSDDMLIIRGVNVFPTQIESVILEMEEFEPHYLLIVGRENNTDTMELQVEVRPDFYSDEINRMLALKKKLASRLQSVLGLGVNVKLVEPRSIERSVGKAKRVIDNRKI